MKVTGLLLMMVLLVGVAGCSNSSDGVGRVAIDGTQWKLTAWAVSSLSPSDFSITAKFADGQVSGHSGVNTYGGKYELGPGTAFSTGPLACTEMAGPEPAMHAEGEYLTLLGQSKSCKLTDVKFTLYDAGGNELLVFDVDN